MRVNPSQKAGKSEGLIYRYIRQGRINIQECSDYSSGRVRTVKKLKEVDLLRAFDLIIEQKTEPDRTIIEQRLNQAEQGQTLTKDSVKEVIEEYFQNRETQLMKPMEEMALYRVGRLEERIENLDKEKELLLQENENLRESIKMLPGPPGEIIQNLTEIKAQKEKLSSALEISWKEKTDLETKLQEEARLKEQTVQALHAIEQEKAKVIKEKEKTTQALHIAQTGKEKVLKEKEEKEKTLQQIKKEKKELQTQKERAVEELQEAQAQKEKELQEQLKEQKEKAEQEEKDLIATLEEMKKRLEEEERKPWWKKIFA